MIGTHSDSAATQHPDSTRTPTPTPVRQGTQEGLSANVLKRENKFANVSRGRCLWPLGRKTPANTMWSPGQSPGRWSDGNLSFQSLFVPVASVTSWNFLNSVGRETPITEPSWGGASLHEWEEGHGNHREDSVFWMSQSVREGDGEGQWGQLNGEWRAGVYLLRQQTSRELTKLPGERKLGCTEVEDKLQLGLPRLCSCSSGLGSVTQRSPEITATHPSLDESQHLFLYPTFL